ncbi:MAG: hypothetical protein Kow0047_06800 [Anaerolineae bacterium]
MSEQVNAGYESVERVSFIGREKELQEIYQRLSSFSPDQPPLIYIEASGGMGKTMLLQEVLRRCRQGEWNGKRWFVASDVIDFYHVSTHTLEGLAQELDRVLRPGPQYLINFRRRLGEFGERQRDLAGLLSQLANLREALMEDLLRDLNAMANDRRIILAFDTAEQLLYEPDEVQAALGVGIREVGIAALGWLLDRFLPQINNIAILIAGRPAPETPPQLLNDLREAVGDARWKKIDLGPFTLDDAKAYWEAIAQQLQKRDLRLAERIQRVPESAREVAWHYTGGRPIMLALMLDYLIRADRLPDEVKVSPEEARQKTDKEPERIRAKLETELIASYQERGGELDDVVRALGWARRGMNRELLAQMLSIEQEDANRLFDAAKQLTFVKHRHEDDRLFLHDEMYSLLWEHALRHDPPSTQDAYRRILSYYEAAIEKARQERSPGLYRMMAEEVYYLLRLDPLQGFQRYYYYMKEAYWANQEATAMELRDELLAFRREAEQQRRSISPLEHADVTCECVLRWIDRAHRRGKYEAAIIMAERAQTMEALDQAFQRAGDLVRAELDDLYGRSLIYAGTRVKQALETLEKARARAETAQHHDEFDSWRRRVVLAEIYDDLGYTLRLQGMLDQAIQMYRRSIALYRQIGELAEPLHANTLNNLAWALALRGRFQEALRAARDGLELRELLGHRGPQALSLNTLGLIQTRSDRPREGMQLCEQALKTFRNLNEPRGIGLSCIALAEARRRSSLEYGTALDERVRLLKEAVSAAFEAVEIFNHEARERVRLIEALIELGCGYREWMQVREEPGYPFPTDPQKDQLLDQAERALQAAYDEARDDLPHLALDAHVNRAWLYFFADDDVRAEQCAGDIFKPDGPWGAVKPYLITADKGLPRDPQNLPRPEILAQLGKAQLLLGRIPLRKYLTQLDELERDDKPKEEKRRLAEQWLPQVAEHFTLALAYDHLFADDFRDLRRAQETIYDALKRFNVAYEFPTFIQGMKQAAAKYHLPEPTHLQRFVEDAFGPLDSLRNGDG